MAEKEEITPVIEDQESPTTNGTNGSHTLSNNANVTSDEQETPANGGSPQEPAEVTGAVKKYVQVPTPPKRTFSNDRYAETDEMVTWEREGAVKIRYGTGELDSKPALTVPSMFQSTVKKFPNQRALAYNEGGKWNFVNYKQYHDNVWATAKSFIKLGLEPYNGVGILGFNAKEWHYSNMGAIFAGGLTTGIYTTNSPEAVAYVVNSAQCNIVVVENDTQLKKVLQVWNDTPTLKAVVQYIGKPSTDKENVYSWADFIQLGSDIKDSDVQERLDAQYVNKCCSLIYTSGTTGKPKGVMLSHDNITFACKVIGEFTKVVIAEERMISYLPLSHIAAQLLDIYLPMCYVECIYFAQPDALKGTLNKTMLEVQPTVFFGVPRVYEKMEDKIKETLKSATGLRKKFADWAQGVGARTATSMSQDQSPPFSAKIANIFYKKIRVATGLTECRYLYCGAAPLSAESHSYLASVGMPVNEVYGMSESTGSNSMTIYQPHAKHWRPHSAGYRLDGFNYDILNPDEKGHGEIAMYGRHVFMGYLGEKEKTLETFDENYKLKSGDVGFVKEDFLFISGRIKELLITAGGENVAPVPIEETVKEELPVISNCMLVGDRQKFLSMIISLKVDVDLDTLRPTENFSALTLEWLSSIGSDSKKVSDILDDKDSKVTKAVEDGIKRANARSESNAKKVQKFKFIPEDFSIFGGELGPTLKVKRPVVIEKYATLINSMYEG